MTDLRDDVTRRAAEAIRTQQTFTREQVAYMVALAYETGRKHAAAEDYAEMDACWREFADPIRSREQRVQARLDEMVAGAEREARHRASRPGPLADIYAAMDWPPVAVPGQSGVTTPGTRGTTPPTHTRASTHRQPTVGRHLKRVA